MWGVSWLIELIRHIVWRYNGICNVFSYVTCNDVCVDWLSVRLSHNLAEIICYWTDYLFSNSVVHNANCGQNSENDCKDYVNK